MHGFLYRLHATDRDDLGTLEHPAPNVEPGDLVMLADGREAIVTARVEAPPGYPIHALLEALCETGSAQLQSAGRNPAAIPPNGLGDWRAPRI